MIQTSYFGKAKNLPNAVAVCQGMPIWYTGMTYQKLAPTWKMIREYKNGLANGLPNRILTCNYIISYHVQVLSKLDAREVYEELDGTILICYESPEKFCHRHLIAQWFEKELGIEVKELE